MFLSERCFRVGNVSGEPVSWMVATCLFNELRYFVLVMIFQIENISSIYLFQASGFLALRSRICDSTFPIKMLAKATAILVPMAVPCVWG